MDERQLSTTGQERSLLTDETGATMLEWTLLVLLIALPGFWLLNLCLQTLLGHYRMISLINSLPFP